MERMSIPLHVYLDALKQAEQRNDKEGFMHLLNDFTVRDNEVFAKLDHARTQIAA